MVSNLSNLSNLNNPINPSEDIKNASNTYKILCDGRSCNKISIYHVKILYLYETCWMCKEHKDYFQKEGWIEYVINTVDGDENRFGRL